MNGTGKTGCRERTREKVAVMNGKADLAAASFVEIGMAREEALRFGDGRLAETIDIVVAVALSVLDAEQRAERQILLHGEARLAGEVLAGDEISCTLRAPLRRAGGVDDGL